MMINNIMNRFETVMLVDILLHLCAYLYTRVFYGYLDCVIRS